MAVGLPGVPMLHFERPSISPLGGETPRNSWHGRQGSFEYDHLENFAPDGSSEKEEGTMESSRRDEEGRAHHARPRVDTCSVSVQFGNTGYECQAICEPETSEKPNKEVSSSCNLQHQEGCGRPVPFASITRSKSSEYDNLHLCHSVNFDRPSTSGAPPPRQDWHRNESGSNGDGCTDFMVCSGEESVRTGWERLSHSQSTPGRLNSPRFSPKHSNIGRSRGHSSPSHSPTHRSLWRRQTSLKTEVQSPSPVILGAPLYEELDSSHYYSWPRNDLSPCSSGSPCPCLPTTTQSDRLRRRTIESPQSFSRSMTRSLYPSRFCLTPPLHSVKCSGQDRTVKSNNALSYCSMSPPLVGERGRGGGVGGGTSFHLHESREVAGSTFSLGSLCSRHSLASSSSRCGREHASYVKGVDGGVFKERMEVCGWWADHRVNYMVL